MVLIPPFEHPFKVVEILSKSFDVISVEKKKYSFKIPTKIANLTKPPLLLASFFYVEQVFKPISNLDLVEFDRFTIEDINKCFTDMNLSSNRTPSNQYPTDFLEPPEPSTSQILSEQITDFNVRLRIAQALGEQAQFPSKRASLKCIVTNFLSYFRLEVGFSTVIPPRSAYSFLNNSPIQHVQLGIPNILVNHNGFLEEVKASSVIDNWISEHYLPISGPKDCKYVVFSPNTIPRTLLISFMKSFMHTYNMFGFGKLQPYSSNAYYFVPENSIDSTAIEFYQNNPLSQFQQIPFITFIVGYPFHDSDFLPHSIVTNIFPPLVYSCTQLGLQSLAFIVYSRIRLFSPTPIGMINTIQNYAVPIIFGFRYQPPFLLPRYGTNSRSISFHFALDIKTNKCAIIDDIGSILHILNLNSLQYLSALIDDCKKLVEQNVSQITVSILSEGLTENFLNDFKNIIPNVLLFSVFPSSCVQGKFENDFDSDTIIFDELEQSFSSDEVLVDPIETCYVLSKIHPPYKVSLYAAGDRNDLLNYVELMSKLSWLSVKPGEEKRTISYPPHICALLRKNRCETIVLSRFEFLPSNGPI
ncbi:uncharacterized protein GO595_006013 [Histomonas meleagridis]|uniref:uncharacterized protein n=1 Tax=Histomonas meleagridis TaxID=135588 RepID=UPI00355A7C1D|nr:hypothetical protein GO595_006013 [Histomonas meleagridis]